MELNLDELDLTAAKSTDFEKSRRSWFLTSMPLFSLEKVFCDQAPQGGAWGYRGVKMRYLASSLHVTIGLKVMSTHPSFG